MTEAKVSSAVSSPMFRRIAWGIGIGFVLMHALVALFHAHESLVNQASELVVSIAERARLMDELTVDRADRGVAFEKISERNFSIEVAALPVEPPPGHRPWHREALVRERSAAGLRELGFDPKNVRFLFHFQDRGPKLLLSVPVEAGTGWINVRASARPARWQRHTAGLVWSSFLALLILAIVLWATRRYTRFLPAFVAAAEQVGETGSARPLPVEGPREIRQLGVAFNTMQQKIRSHERDRSAMLGAVSHDLRTLVTRLSLRLEQLADVPAREKVADDLHSMTRIVDEALAYSRDEVELEPRTLLDLCSLVQTLIDDTNDAQGDAQSGLASDTSSVVPIEGILSASGPIHLSAQPVALKRAVQNVLDNALLYGGKARVSVFREQGMAVIEVSDTGPGIPGSEQERVLKPYVRLEDSRNRQTGGTGLGLAIVHNVLRRHGGQIEFAHRADTVGGKEGDEGYGFAVRLKLPVD